MPTCQGPCYVNLHLPPLDRTPMGMIRRWPTVTAQTVKQPPSNPRLKSLFAAPGGGCGFPPGCTMLFPACHVTCGTAHPPELRQLILSSLVAFTTAVQHFTCLEPCPCLLLRAGHFVVPHNPPKVFSLIFPNRWHPPLHSPQMPAQQGKRAIWCQLLVARKSFMAAGSA